MVANFDKSLLLKVYQLSPIPYLRGIVNPKASRREGDKSGRQTENKYLNVHCTKFPIGSKTDA